MNKPVTPNNRLLIKVTRESLPQIKDKYPFIYLERGRLEIDDSSIKWINADGDVVRLPIATACSIVLGPGTSITHEAVKVLASSNCTVCWTGEDGMIFYATGINPTADTKNFKHQVKVSGNAASSLEAARRMFAMRFPGSDLAGKTLKEMMGMEGYRVRDIYAEKAKEYNVGWAGRICNKDSKGFNLNDITNQVLTSSNGALYGIVTSCIVSLGYSPHVGFIHSGSPLPFTYDIADLYKEYLCIDLAFALTARLAGEYNKHVVANEFKKRLVEKNILGNIAADIKHVLGQKS